MRVAPKPSGLAWFSANSYPNSTVGDMADPLFSVRNNFYLGSFNTVLNDAADIENVSELEAIERDVFIYRSYIALGSFEVRMILIREIQARVCQRQCLPCCRSW